MAATMPTRGASETNREEWAGKPAVAWVLRAVAFAAPILTSWLVVRTTSSHYWRPAGPAGLVAWIAQVMAVGSATVLLVGRVSRRLLPLAALYRLTIAFPDHAPSRFRVALRSGNLRTVQARFAEVQHHGLGADRAESMSFFLEMVAALSKHEPRTRGHTDRVRAYTDLIAEEMGLDADERDKLRWAAMLHDIGKLSVPAEILNKAGRPTDEEWKTLVRHPLIGGEIVEELADWLGPWRLAASEHHERWDGKGYPRGLAGEQISLAGRIVAVADAYDVITSARSYKKPMSAEAARRELVRCAGTQFDPAVVRAFLNLSIGRRPSRSGMLGWLVELPRGIAGLATQAASATSGVVAASSLATVAAVATVAPPAAPVTLAAPAPVAVVATSTTAVAPLVAARETPTTAVVPTTSPPRAAVVAAEEPPSTSAATAPTTTVAPTTTRVTAAAPTTTARPATTTTRASSAPIARNDFARVSKGTPQHVHVLDNDSDRDGDLDPASLTISEEPGRGRATVVGDRISFEAPTSDGWTSLTYRVCDLGGRCSHARLVVEWD